MALSTETFFTQISLTFGVQNALKSKIFNKKTALWKSKFQNKNALKSRFRKERFYMKNLLFSQPFFSTALIQNSHFKENVVLCLYSKFVSVSWNDPYPLDL